MRDWQAFVRVRLQLPDLTPEREQRIVRELAAQLEDFYREALAAGATEADADARARRQIHDWKRMADDVRRADRRHARPRVERLADSMDTAARPSTYGGGAVRVLATMLRDMRYAVRQLIKTPAFTVVAILTLGLGIGATSATFSVVNGVLLRPLPYRDPDRLVRVFEVVPQYGRFSVAPANFLDWRQQNSVFERIATHVGGSATLSAADGPERVLSTNVSWDIFDLLGIAPALGRTFRADEDAPGKDAVIILSHGFWQRRFGGDPGVLGRAVTLNGAPFTVIGVMPPDFYFPSRTTEYWKPIALNPANATRGGHYLGVIARLKAGVTEQQAATEMQAIAERLALQYPQNSANESAEVSGLHEQIVTSIRPALLTLLAAVGVVVLIACANVANLLLVRASVREKEIAIRAALGAGRRRLVVQMLAESLVLAAAGGALGLLIAYLAIAPIQTLGAASIPRASDIAIDARVLGFALLASLLTGLVFGLVPAWHASRASLGEVMKEGGRSSTGSGGRWLRGSLLVAEVALSIVLLVGAALLLRSFSRLTSVDPGFDAGRVLAFQVALPQVTYKEDHQRVAFFDALIQKLEAAPGVRKAGMVQSLPMRGNYVLSFTVQGRPAPLPGEGASANHRAVSPGYFNTLGVRLVRGRAFTERDGEKAPMVAVVDEGFVRKHFPNEDPIGRGIDIGNGTDGFYEIVGVVSTVKHNGLDAAPDATMYVPFKQDVFGSMWVVARTDGDPAQLAPVARQAVRETDPSLPAYSILPLAQVVDESVADRRFSMLLLAVFALIALFLAAVGLYGVVAYSVSQRTPEIGLRMAIGASPSDVLRMVVGGGMKLALIGVAIGLVSAVALAQFVGSMLYEVTPLDPASYAGTAALLLVVAALACFVPARRAMRVDPLVALRQE